MLDAMTIICAVNSEHTLQRDLMASPMVCDDGVPVFTYRGAQTAGEAYNAGIEATSGEYMIFVHQDVYLPLGWDLNLQKNIHILEENEVRWAVLGCMGITRSGVFAGTVWSAGSNREYDNTIEEPTEVRSLDEVVLVVRRSTGVRFDSGLPHFHLYGTDVVLSAARAGYRSFAIHAPVVHNSNQLRGLDEGYRRAFDYMRGKWSQELPLRTPVCTLSSNRFSLLRTHFRLSRRHLAGRLRGRTLNGPLPNPRRKAQELGYEKPRSEAVADRSPPGLTP